MSEFATVELVRQWVREHPASSFDGNVVDEIRGELARRASGSSAGAWDVGGMCRTLAKRGVPLPPGLGGLTPPTARNWLRGILALNADSEVTDDALSLAISAEINRELQLLNGQRGVSVVVASKPTPAAAVAEPTNDEVLAAFRLRFHEFPTPSPAVQAAVAKWEAANKRPFPWPDADPVEPQRDEVLDELRVGLRGEVLDELRVGLRGEVRDELRLDLGVEVRANMLAGAEALLAELRLQAAPPKTRGRRAE